jgi:hypothetical protein
METCRESFAPTLAWVHQVYCRDMPQGLDNRRRLRVACLALCVIALVFLKRVLEDSHFSYRHQTRSSMLLVCGLLRILRSLGMLGGAPQREVESLMPESQRQSIPTQPPKETCAYQARRIFVAQIMYIVVVHVWRV